MDCQHWLRSDVFVGSSGLSSPAHTLRRQGQGSNPFAAEPGAPRRIATINRITKERTGTSRNGRNLYSSLRYGRDSDSLRGEFCWVGNAESMHALRAPFPRALWASQSSRSRPASRRVGCADRNGARHLRAAHSRRVELDPTDLTHREGRGPGGSVAGSAGSRWL
jgi:hypothetical protein